MTSDFASDITPTADISDLRLTTKCRIKAIERELDQLRDRARVAPHVLYHTLEYPDVSDPDSDPAIIFG
jgi:hypothetical protein